MADNGSADRLAGVVLPALNEEETVADVIATIMPLYGTLVDEIIVRALVTADEVGL